VWTPRRILLLVLGIVASTVIYVGYHQVLGSIDGLPNLPDKYLISEPGTAPPPEPRELPTLTRLKEAFGQNCPEVERVDVYPFRVQDLQEGVVIAAGRPDLGDGPSRFIRFAPFSMAQFGKAKNPGEPKLPGEVTEVTTLHADVAIVEFDREINSDRDLLTRKGKMIGLELQAVPNRTARTDPRNGRVLITNNQRYADPNKSIVFKTPGPVFYRTQDHPAMAQASAAHIETTARVEIVNRENQPKPIRSLALLPSVPVEGFGMLPEKVVADMALGLHTPPPTIEAEGMKIYLKPNKPDPKTAAKRTTTGFSGVREIVLLEDVLFNLWTDGSGGIVGGTQQQQQQPNKPLMSEAPLALASLGGGLVEGTTVADRLRTKSLVRIRTLGQFRYDWEKNAVRFEIAVGLNPLLPNNVEVERLSPIGGRDHLACQLLEIEFNTPQQDQPLAKAPSSPGPNIKMLRASGTSVYLSSASDGMQAFGTMLIHETDAAKRLVRTRLQGTPLVAVRQGNRLTAGVPASKGVLAKSGELILDTWEPAPESKQPKSTIITILGPGKVDLFDEATKTATLTASWRESLVQMKDMLGGKVVDLLTFKGDGDFSDPRSGFELRGDTLKLWLDGGERSANGSPDQSKPVRLQGLGNVRGKSDDSILRDIDTLNVWFKDGERPAKPVVQAPTPARTLPISTTPTTNVRAASKPATTTTTATKPAAPVMAPFGAEPVAVIPAKPRPLELSARIVEAWVLRYPDDPTLAAKSATRSTPPPGPPGLAGVKYELDRATCDGRVEVKQEPIDPRKSINGLHIISSTLALDHFPTGHRLHVHGTNEKWAYVQFEDTTITGAEVLIDQPNNAVNVPTNGRLHMPSGSDLSGVPLANRNDLIVEWTEQMKFFGERRSADFVGGVRAVQQPAELPKLTNGRGPITVNRSYVYCHRMAVVFDRPVYFNQLRNTGSEKSGKNDAAKIERVQCEPIPDEVLATNPTLTGDVIYTDETIDITTKKFTKAQRITARFLDVRVGDEKTQIEARGPGETRGLQMGNKDGPATPAGSPPPTAPPAAVTNEQEMKLTVVRFEGRLSITDQKQIFQKAIFTNHVRAFHIPTDEMNLDVVEHALPIRAFVLKCEEKLTATSYRQSNGQEDRRTMEAIGNSRFRTDDYDGFGHIIRFEDPLFVLEGYGDGQATMQRRQGTFGREKDYKSGNPLTYNRRTGQVSGSESSGGSFTSNGK
jgi:hypothetical protein